MVGIIIIFAFVMSVIINFVEKKAGFGDDEELTYDQGEADKVPVNEHIH